MNAHTAACECGAEASAPHEVVVRSWAEEHAQRCEGTVRIDNEAITMIQDTPTTGSTASETSGDGGAR